MAFDAPAWEIYGAYERIMETKQRGDSPLPKQLKQRFGIAGWEWSRLKLVCEAARGGDERAVQLIAEIDQGVRTVSEAYGFLLQQRRDDAANADGPPRPVNLEQVEEKLSFVAGWAATMHDSLRRGARIEAGGMSADSLRKLQEDVFRASTDLRAVHQFLSKIMNER